MKKAIYSFGLAILSGIVLFVSMDSCSSKKDDPTPGVNNTTTGTTFGTAAAIVITTGAQSLQLGEKLKLEANLIDANGNIKEVTDATWTSSNTDVASISSNELSSKASGQTKITVTYTVGSTTVSNSIIIGVAQKTTVFTVAPQAIIWSTGSGTITLTPVYFGSGTPSFTYTSSNTSIVSVSSGGEVTFVAAGEASFTVKATGLEGTPSVVVPVLVVGNITSTVTLPVSRVVITPPSATLFKNETATFSAKAYNSNNAEVTGETALWSVENDKANFYDNAVTIDQTGKITAHSVGSAIVFATIKGIKAQAQVQVLPDSVLLVTPYYSALDAGATKQFSASLFTVNRSTKLLNTVAITTPSNLKWEIPSLGAILPALSVFDVATVSSTGLVTVKTDAIAGNSTVIIASIPGTSVEGAALITVKIPGVYVPGGIPDVPGF